jgi:protease I
METFAILLADGFDVNDVEEPRRALDAVGATVRLVALAPGTVRASCGDELDVEETVDHADPDEYDGLIVLAGDAIRASALAIDFVRAFFAESKPVIGARWASELHDAVIEGSHVTNGAHVVAALGAPPRSCESRTSVLPHNVNGSGAIHGELMGER